MNRGLVDVTGCFVNDGLVDDLFPLTPTLSLGEREKKTRRFTIPMHEGGTQRLFMNRRSSNVSAAGLRHSRGPWKGRLLITMRARSEMWLSTNPGKGALWYPLGRC
jgi:hypothetical protein